MAANSNFNQRNSDVSFVVPDLPQPCRFFPIGVINPSFQLSVPQGEVLVRVNRPPQLSSMAIPVRFPLNPAVLIRVDQERSNLLLQFMANEGLVPSAEEETKRKQVMEKLKQIVLVWIKTIAWSRGFPREQISGIAASILTYGSYGLGVHDTESDIDALCVGPYFANVAEDFFVVLRNMLNGRPDVSEILCVKDAKVPLMRFKIDGISIDLPYAQLRVPSVPENLDVFNPLYLKGINETSWKSLSGVRTNKSILQLVPHVKNFQSLLRCVKLWAKRRGVYGNFVGYFGGVHLAILVAFICQRNPNASLNALISTFFWTFALWPWPTPVMLQDGMCSPHSMGSFGKNCVMPIRLPCSPCEYCHSNITKSTFYRIRAEFFRGHAITKDILQPNFEWRILFEELIYSKTYPRFVKIYISAFNKDMFGNWAGWVRSRFRGLILKLEEVQGFCDPNPTEYVDLEADDPNVVFFWGLGTSNFTDIQYVEKYFLKYITNGYHEVHGKLGLSIVQDVDLLNGTRFVVGRNSKGTKSC